MTRLISRPRRSFARLAVAMAAAMLVLPSAARAQIDPLISLKRVPPRIILVFDTSFAMLYDMTDYDYTAKTGAVYCDPAIYTRSNDPLVASALGVSATESQYRRRFTNLSISTLGIYTATGISTQAGSSSDWGNPCANTRYEIARKGIYWALNRSGNPRLHWGLVKLRQTTPTWRTAASSSCERVMAPIAGGDISPCLAGGTGFFAINPPSVASANTSAAAAAALLTANPGQAGTLNTTYFDVSSVPIPKTSTEAGVNKLIPAGKDTATTEDRPLANTLIDVKTEVVRAMTADSYATQRNTVVVLIAAGRDYSGDPVTKAAEFLNIGGGGATRRVPIFVVGVSPKSSEDTAQLKGIASASGGVYVNATDAHGVERAINLAIQAGCQRPSEVDAGDASEFTLVSPVIGTVNLENGVSAEGASLPNTVITSGTATIPQRNNIMITAGFRLGPAGLSSGVSWNPGFEGRLHAYRVYKPVADSSKASGYSFNADGTPLWPKGTGDSRPDDDVKGVARTPPNPDDRNIFTYVPGTGMVAFTTANAATLTTALNTSSPSDLITKVRELPLGAVVSSTPAIMDPPSLDPPPDDDYGRPDAIGTYAYEHKDRRSIIWIGTNDGMLHAIDARTGYEVWAFIPYNLLPKLQALLEGQSPYEFTYFVDHSAKIAEVKMSGEWKTMLVIGEGWGGTFYQAFDVTEAGMDGPDPNSDNYSGVLSTFADPARVQFKWSFPDYQQFDPTMGGGSVRMRVAATTSFGRVKFYGDLKTTASAAEKQVGFAWSDPAVGALDASRSVNAAIVGSGYFPAEAEASTSVLLARRDVSVGHTFFLINMATGKLVGNASGSACTGTGCYDVGDSNSYAAKNALQADPTVTSDYGSYVAKKAYIGDLDGNYWRFTFNSSGTITKTVLAATGQPIYASSALMWVGTADQYIFFATGSDMLPTSPSATHGTGTFKLHGLSESAGTVTEAFTPKDLDPVTNFIPESTSVTDYNGAAVGIPVGERPSTSPSVAGEIVFFTTSVEYDASTAVADVNASSYNLYAVTYQGSNAYLSSTTTTTTKNSKKSTSSKTLTSVKSGAGRATAPFVVDQHLYFATSTSTGAKVEAFGDPKDFNNGVGQVGVRILSWREIRR